MAGKLRDANGDGDPSQRLALVQNRQLAQFGADALGAGLTHFQIRLRENDQKFLTAEAANDVLGAKCRMPIASPCASNGMQT